MSRSVSLGFDAAVFFVLITHAANVKCDKAISSPHGNTEWGGLDAIEHEQAQPVPEDLLEEQQGFYTEASGTQGSLLRRRRCQHFVFRCRTGDMNAECGRCKKNNLVCQSMRSSINQCADACVTICASDTSCEQSCNSRCTQVDVGALSDAAGECELACPACAHEHCSNSCVKKTRRAVKHAVKEALHSVAQKALTRSTIADHVHETELGTKLNVVVMLAAVPAAMEAVQTYIPAGFEAQLSAALEAAKKAGQRAGAPLMKKLVKVAAAAAVSKALDQDENQPKHPNHIKKVAERDVQKKMVPLSKAVDDVAQNATTFALKTVLMSLPSQEGASLPPITKAYGQVFVKAYAASYRLALAEVENKSPEAIVIDARENATSLVEPIVAAEVKRLAKRATIDSRNALTAKKSSPQATKAEVERMASQTTEEAMWNFQQEIKTAATWAVNMVVAAHQNSPHKKQLTKEEAIREAAIKAKFNTIENASIAAQRAALARGEDTESREWAVAKAAEHAQEKLAAAARRRPKQGGDLGS